MFRRLAKLHNADDILNLHPAQLAFLAELAWCTRLEKNDVKVEVGWPGHRSDVFGEGHSAPNRCPKESKENHSKLKDLEDTVAKLAADQAWDGVKKASGNGGIAHLIDHLIYAYIVESTGVVDVFRRVLFELLHGEKLGVPNKDAHNWLRTTEALCFRDPPPYSILAVTSKIRPDADAVRRNAYYRMFGADLPNGPDSQKTNYTRADAANQDFFRTLTDFFRELWTAWTNISNTSGTNLTDIGKIRELATRLRDMLLTRRESGNLSREEFVHVAMMSWFHLALDSDTPIITTLKAEATSPEQRLFKLAQRVQAKVDTARAKAYFEIAEPLSDVLIAIERGDFDTDEKATSQYYRKEDNTGAIKPGYLGDQLRTIITHWETVTGGEVKARRVAASGAPVTA